MISLRHLRSVSAMTSCIAGRNEPQYTKRSHGEQDGRQRQIRLPLLFFTAQTSDSNGNGTTRAVNSCGGTGWARSAGLRVSVHSCCTSLLKHGPLCFLLHDVSQWACLIFSSVRNSGSQRNRSGLCATRRTCTRILYLVSRGSRLPTFSGPVVPASDVQRVAVLPLQLPLQLLGEDLQGRAQRLGGPRGAGRQEADVGVVALPVGSCGEHGDSSTVKKTSTTTTTRAAGSGSGGLTALRETSQQLPVGQHHLHPEEEEHGAEEHNGQGGEDVDGHCGVEGAVVGCRGGGGGRAGGAGGTLGTNVYKLEALSKEEGEDEEEEEEEKEEEEEEEEEEYLLEATPLHSGIPLSWRRSSRSERSGTSGGRWRW